MAETDTERKMDRRIDLLYKNLAHLSSAYFQAESVFPSWEAAFAIIVGQIFIAYFGQGVCPSQKNLLLYIGVVLSLIWFILVSLNLQNALYMEGKIEDMHKQLDKELMGSCSGQLHFIKPWPESKDNWTPGNIFWGTRPKKNLKISLKEDTKDKNWPDRLRAKYRWLKKISKTTWFYRRVLPLILCLFWILFWNIWAFYGAVAIIAIWFLLFDPGPENDAESPSSEPLQEAAVGKS